MKKLLLIAVIAGMALAGCKGDKKEDVKVYTVTFDADGGAPLPPKQTVEAGEMATAPNTPAKAGYVFMFWSLNGANTAYNFQTPITGDITLVAKWQSEATVEYWQVSWNLNGGAWTAGYTPPAQVVKGGTLAEPTPPTKAGNTLEGWYKEAALTNKVNFPYDVSGVTANITLYANWAAGSSQLSVSPAGAILFTKEGGAKTIAVTTDQSSWNAVSSETWCVVAKGTNQFTITAAANAGGKRTATITVSAGSAENVIIEVTQEANARLEVFYPFYHDNAYGMTPVDAPIRFLKTDIVNYKYIEVITDQPSWEAKSDQPWCTIEVDYTKEEEIFDIIVANNPSDNNRTATVTVTAGNAPPVTISVKQAGQSAFLTVSPTTNITFTNVGGESGVYTVSTNQQPWNVESTMPWCTVNKNGDSFTVTATENTGSGQRGAFIMVSSEFMYSVIHVIQAGTGVVGGDATISVTMTNGTYQIFVQRLEGGSYVNVSSITGSNATRTEKVAPGTYRISSMCTFLSNTIWATSSAHTVSSGQTLSFTLNAGTITAQGVK